MNRRHFILQTAAATVPLAGWGAPAPQRIIDTHVHFYDPTRPEGVPWPPAGSPIHRRTLPAVEALALEYFTPKGADVVDQVFWKNSQAAYRWTRM